MVERLKTLLLNRFDELVAKLSRRRHRRRIDEEYDRRVDVVRSLFMTVLPGIDRRFFGTTVIEGGRWNICLDDGEYPVIDFALPRLGLFVFIGRPVESSLSTALAYGFEEAEWVKAQTRLRDLRQTATSLGARWGSEITFLFLDWETSMFPMDLVVTILDNVKVSDDVGE